MTTVPAEPRGLGGWLILPAIGLCITPVRMLMVLAADFLPIFREGYWEILTTPGSAAYHYLYAPLIIYEIAANLAFALFAVVLLFLFFRKSHRFPPLCIAYYAANVLFVVSDWVLGGCIPDLAAQPDPGAMQELVRSVVGAGIWIPYMLRSQRVKNTFVKEDSGTGLQPVLPGNEHGRA